LITHSDDGPDFEPDDPLAIILRPTFDYLGPPTGRYEAIRRGAGRRRLLRTAAGVGLSCAVAVLIALPLHLATLEAPASPAVPLAPPPVSSPSVTPTLSASPEPVSHRPTRMARTDRPAPPARGPVPTLSAPAPIPTPQSVEPSAVRNGARPTLGSGTRP
jgi:hypothetical protein